MGLGRPWGDETGAWRAQHKVGTGGALGHLNYTFGGRIGGDGKGVRVTGTISGLAFLGKKKTPGRKFQENKDYAGPGNMHRIIFRWWGGRSGSIG